MNEKITYQMLQDDNLLRDNQFLLRYALNEVQTLNPEELFLLKDLFPGYVWTRIPKPSRQLLGTLFLHHITSDPNSVAIPFGKTSSNQQIYKKLFFIITRKNI